MLLSTYHFRESTTISLIKKKKKKFLSVSSEKNFPRKITSEKFNSFHKILKEIENRVDLLELFTKQFMQ